MASILDRYGIKEVADFTFYEINADGTPGAPVLFLDTLKVSTIETGAETTYSQGGKGNANLIAWDYGKEITVAIEDALFSPKSMAVMFGDGKVDTDGGGGDPNPQLLYKTTSIVFDANNLPNGWTDQSGNFHKFLETQREIAGGEEVGVIYAHVYNAEGSEATYKEEDENIPVLQYLSYNDDDELVWIDNDVKEAILDSEWQGSTVFLKHLIITTDWSEITISASEFPGTYYATGDTFVRNEDTGKDEAFQIIIPKVKVTSENTITLEADGDPSVFSMNLSVLRPKDGNMMKLIKYTA